MDDSLRVKKVERFEATLANGGNLVFTQTVGREGERERKRERERERERMTHIYHFQCRYTQYTD